jgi:RNase P subunit RPR2
VQGGNVVVTCLYCRQRRRYPVGRDRKDG